MLMVENPVEILDTTLRDGSYSIDFQFTADDTALIASALESAGIVLIEVAHGMGLGAARAGKGDQAATDEAYLSAAASVLRTARFGAFFIPGIGAEDDLRLGAGNGMQFVRIGTDITDLERAAPFVALAKNLGLRVSCNLMKSYAVAPEEFGRRARAAEELGADIVCLVDSAGGMFPEEVRAYVHAARSASNVRIGFHGHDNLCLGLANTLEACDAGATVLDASLQGIGRSEGNTVTEVLAAVLQKRDLLPHVDVNALLDIGEAFIRPLMCQRGRSPIGITSGRARFHSSFLERVLRTAAKFGVDERELVLRMGEHNQLDAPLDVLEELARTLAPAQSRKRVWVHLASVKAEVPDCFESAVRERARELREKSRKLGKESVLNVVVTPYEITHVSPFVESGYGGIVMSNVMLAGQDLLGPLLNWVDGLTDYVLLDPAEATLTGEALKKSILLLYSDHEMWARATVVHLCSLLEPRTRDSTVVITGVPALAVRAAVAFAEVGARVLVDENIGSSCRALAPHYLLECAPLEEAVGQADAVVSLSPRKPAIQRAHVQKMRRGTILYDGGIGSLERDAVPAAEERGIRVFRVDMRPSLAATAVERIAMRRLVTFHAGRDIWDGVSVVAGGLIGREGEIIVNSISYPTRVIGVADGIGGILRADGDDRAVQTVRRVIAQKLLNPHEATEDFGKP
jgi:4-hydroxy-2-oxovalerate aldolase